MKKAGQWKNRMVLALELPPDLAYNSSAMKVTGSIYDIKAGDSEC